MRKHSYQIIDYAEDLLSALQGAETAYADDQLTQVADFCRPTSIVAALGQDIETEFPLHSSAIRRL